MSTQLGKVFNVMNYGATGDGSTDDTAAIQAAIDAAAAVSGAVAVPVADPLYLVTELDLAVGTGGIVIRGNGMGSLIRSSTGSVFKINGTNSDVHMSDLHLQSLSSGKACFEFVDGGSLYQSRIERVHMHTFSNTGHVIKGTGSTWEMFDTTWADCIYSGDGQALSTSLIHLDNEDGGKLNQVTWIGGRFICGAGFTAPAIFIGSTDSAANWVFNNTFEKINVEVCAGGFIQADGVSSLVIRDVGIYDTVVTNVDMIVLGKTGGVTLNSQYTLVENFWRFGGSHSAGSYDLDTEFGNYTTVINSGGVPSGNGAIKVGPFTTIINKGTWSTIVGRNVYTVLANIEAKEEASNFELDWEDSVINVTSASARIVTLPDNAAFAGKNYLIRRDGANTVTINRAGSDTFDDATTSKILASDGAAIGIFSIGDGEWKIVGIQGTVT